MKKVLFLLALALLLVSCPKANNNATGGGRAKLQIAVEESYVPYFERITQDFQRNHEVDFEIVGVKMFDVLDNLAIQRGNSADIFMIVNDRVGDLSEQRLIEAMSFNISGYTDNARMAGTYQNQLYFVPMSTDTTLLIYNKDKVAGAPTYLSQLNPSDWAAKFTDFYHAAGMLSTKGGYIFGNDENDLGLANSGAIEAGRAIQSLYGSGVSHWTLMRDDTISYDVMMKALADGDVNYIINGPWALADIAAAGVNAGVAPIPSWDGSHPYQALVGTKGMGLNAFSRNKEMAQKFLQFLATKEHAQVWYEMTDEVAPHTGVVYPEGSLQEIAFIATSTGQSMPNLPAFKTIWEPMADALKQIANGENPQAALEAAQNRIARDIEDVNRR
ncbi:sugar ABC transporter substrate-binding protein [Entomospira culicis]|uniref:Extracellular solute-binding protein n=1 Tax=Entomospira culicis TaxID=2719989 RepID=A0A968GJB6_9SPIO|nr:extracellular solute-binding protein [Entomospira culicis]NIZ19883.1 extracellular solute-binding protein [Entomospira culicis]NIZ70097.1 extracellular solute-binding protein [Entomospira culicis]WDI37201.1 extracellular solute-binding protein [Entomospira culicis]WDI38830.1 extracellular solute-binding protein [Entomospira culicis]